MAVTFKLISRDAAPLCVIPLHDTTSVRCSPILDGVTMETAKEGEGDSLARSTTASEPIREGPRSSESEKNDSPFKEDSLQQMLTCETGNTGTEASTPPSDSEATGQGLPGTSPASDNLDKVLDAGSLIKLEACDEADEACNLERHIELEATSSDETGDWETASEASVASEETTEVESANENLDSSGNMDINSLKETEDNLKIETCSGNLEKTGSDGAGELAKEVLEVKEQFEEQFSERTCDKDPQSEQAFTHGTGPVDTVSEESLCDVNKSESEEIPPHSDEALRDGTVSEDHDPNVEEMVTVECVSHSGNKQPEKLNDEESVEEPGSGGFVTHAENSGLHDVEAVSEWTKTHEENGSHNVKTDIKGIDTQMDERTNEGIEPQMNESANEQAEPPVTEPDCEAREPQDDKTLPHTNETVQKCSESLVEVTDSENTVPDCELVSTETEHNVIETLGEQCSPPMEEADSDGKGHHPEEAVCDHAESHAEESTSEVTMFPDDTNEPYVEETLSVESGSCIDERDHEGTATYDEACVSDETGTCVGERASEGTLNNAGDSGSGESGTHAVGTISEETKSMSDHTLSTGNHITNVIDENDNADYVIDKEQGPLDISSSQEAVDSKSEVVNNEEAVDAQSTIHKDSGIDQKEMTEGKIENEVIECVSEETASKVTAHDHKEGASQLLDVDPKGTLSKDTEGVSTETVCQEISGSSEETVGTETESVHSETDNEHIEGGTKETVIQVTMGHTTETAIGNHTESCCIETDDGSIEVLNVETPCVCDETSIKYKESVTEDAHTDSGHTLEHDKAADDIQRVDCKESLDETPTADHREIIGSMKETLASESIEKQNEEATSSFVEITEECRDSQNKENTFEERITSEPSIEERESSKQRGNQENVELTMLVGLQELSGQISEIPQNVQNQRCIVTERTAEENESEPNADGKSWHAEETGFQAPKEDTETMSQEGENLDLISGEIEAKENNLEANIKLSEDLLEAISQKTSFETDVSQAVSINDGISYMNVHTETGAKTATAEQGTLDELTNKEIEEGESDKEQSLNDTETNGLSGILVAPLLMKTINLSDNSFQNFDVVKEPEEPNTQNLQVVDSGDSHHKDNTDSAYRELSSPLQETLNLAVQTEDQEKIQGVIQEGRTVVPQSEIQFSEEHKELEDEPDGVSPILIFNMGLKGTFVPKTEASTKPETCKKIVEGTMLAIAAEPIVTDETMVYGGKVADDQVKLEPEVKTDQHAVESMIVDSLPFQIKRRRSNTDPCLSYDQAEKDSSQKDDQHAEISSRPRLRSVTPPLDNFIASFTARSPQAVLEGKLPETSEVVYPPVDYNISEKQEAEESTQKTDYTFFPTQIFNPLFFIQEGKLEHGFYQRKPLIPHVQENTTKRRTPSPPRDTEVLLKGQQPVIISRTDRSPLPSGATVETSDTDPPAAQLVTPLWLPPRPLRHNDSAVGKEFRALKPTENPLVRRTTIRHKKNPAANPPFKRFGAMNLPMIPQEVPAGETSSLEKSIRSAGTKVFVSSTARNRALPRQPKMNEQDIGQPKNKSPMERLAEAEESSRTPTKSPEPVIRRGKQSQIQPTSDNTFSTHRRYSTFIHNSSLLYQEYSDVALNQEIQRQKPGDSPAEEKDPGSPRLRRRLLSSQDSYLQRLSISSADSLWQDLPKVRDSVTFMTMSREEQKLQEAKFELIMSEALYLRSLNIAVDHFQRSTELQDILSSQDRQWLFSRLSEVRDASNDFLFDLEEEFENNMYNFQVCDVVISHEPNFRKVYLPYVTNQSYQDRTFQKQMNDNPRFQQVLSKLESDPVCQRLSLKSFLILPFQRITRLRLLLQNILKRSAPGSNEELQATEAHNAIEKLIRDCNEGVQKMKDTEELILLHQKIQFECKIFPLISASRRLVKHGEVTSLEFNPISYKWKGTTRQVYLHLFSDCLLLSRTREGGRFVVFDHASAIRVERCEMKLHSNQKNMFRVFLLDSAATQGRDGYLEGHGMQYILRTETQSQKLRWIYALSPPREELDFQKDGLRQVQCLKSYKARENDEISLEKADILMVTQNSDDGWLCGVRLSDLHSGWFPQSHVQFISQNACLRNLQEGQRLQSARAKLCPTGATRPQHLR